MKTVEMSGKTVDEAIYKALESLNEEKDNVIIEVIDEGTKGLFNLIGGKPAKVKVTVKPNHVDEAKKFLIDVLANMKIDAEVTVKEEKDLVTMSITGPKMGLIIGYRGETLDSLQYLVSLIVNKDHDKPYKKVVLDTENYRQKREETLKKVAQKAAYKVKMSKRPYKLEPMNPYERRIIHSALQDDKDVITHSEGEEPHRRVVIEIKK